jgi:hypothetical protein
MTFVIIFPVYLESNPRLASLYLHLPSSVHSSKFRIPQVLYLPLLRKHRGCGGVLPILELDRGKITAGFCLL